MSDSKPAGWRIGDALRQRPAVLLLALLAGGILCRNLLPILPWLWVTLAAIFLAAALATVGRSKISNFCLAASILFTGLLAAQIEHFQFPSNSIGLYAADQEQFAQLELKLNESPRLLTPPPDQLRVLPPRQIALAQVLAVRTDSGWQTASGEISLSIENLNPRLAVGQTIRVAGMLEQPSPMMNPGQYDWVAYDRKQRMLAGIRVLHADAVEIIQDQGPSLLSQARNKARHLLAMGFDANHGAEHALLRALTLGDSDPQLRDLQDEFSRTGTIHYLSISGLHVAILGGLILLLCRLLRCPPRISLILFSIVVIIYSMIAVPSWPGVRSAIMCVAAALGLLWRRPTDSIQLLAIAVAAVLIIQPGDMVDPGFQISFAAVLGMILFSNAILGWFWNWWRSPDDIALGRPRLNRPQIAVRWAIRFMVGILVAGGVAWMMVLPLAAYHFGQVSLYSVPAGIVLLPLTVLALFGGLMKILLTMCWPSGASIWASASGAPIHWMRHVVDNLDKLPGSSFQAAAPSIWAVTAFFAVVALIAFPFKKIRTKWLARLAIVPAIAGLFLFPASTQSIAGAAHHHHIQITLLSLGAGQTAVVRPDDDHADLIDAGSSTVSDVMRSLLVPYMRLENCRHIDRIFLSHGDFDHISAAADIFQTYAEPDILISPHFARHAVGNLPAEELLKTIELAGRDPRIIHQGDHVDLGNSAWVDVLWPPVDCPMDSNDCGLVLKLHYAGRTILFPADIQVKPEQALLRHPELLKSDILIAPHHGSAETTTAEFIKAVAPRMILASNAIKLTHKQRLFDDLAAHYPLYRTSRCGAITITITDDGNISVETFTGVGPVKSDKISK